MKRLFANLTKILQQLSGQSINQVNANIVKPGLLQGVYGILCCSCIMTSIEHFQYPVIETLYAQTDAVETKVAQVVCKVGCNIVGVSFERDFSVGINIVVFVDTVEKYRNLFYL